MYPITINIRKVLAANFTLTLYALAFAIPMLLNSQQIVTGALVNCFLFLAAERLDKKSMIPILILPSLGAAAHGILFGPNTVFLYYFFPFIWIGNYSLTWTFSRLQTAPFFMRVIAASVVKYLILVSAATFYVRAHIAPPLFATAMGYMQLFTAIVGGILAYGITTHLHDRRRNTY